MEASPACLTGYRRVIPVSRGDAEGNGPEQSGRVRSMLLPVPKESVIYRALSEGAVLFSLTDEVYFGLNTVGAVVWELLPPATRTFDSLLASLSARYPGVPVAQLRDDVTELLEELTSFGLVTHLPAAGSLPVADEALASRLA